MNFRMIQVLIKCFERSTVERLRRIRTTCPVVYLYVRQCKYINAHKYGHGEMRDKKLINRRNDVTQGWQFWSPKYSLGKGRGKKEKKVIARQGIRIWSPTQLLTLPNRA